MSAWMRDMLCDLLHKAYGRDDNHLSERDPLLTLFCE
jgi:hypothetical protein